MSDRYIKESDIIKMCEKAADTIETEDGELIADITAENYIAKDGYSIRLVPYEDEKSTSDGVEVVRCKDCIHRYVTGDVTEYYVCDFMDAQYEDNGYCHHGERREP